MNDMILKIIRTNEPDLLRRKSKNPVSYLDEKIKNLDATLFLKPPVPPLAQ